MSRPRKLSSLISRILDTNSEIKDIVFDGYRKSLFVKLVSLRAWMDLLENIDLPVLERYEMDTIDLDLEPKCKRKVFCIKWDCKGFGKEEKLTTGFSFGKDVQKRARRLVTAQEEDGAEMIGGTRHVGSGAIEGLKSDASSAVWQQEAKQTHANSFRLGLDVLEKITKEARVQGKRPMVFLRFTNIPEWMVVESDWVIVPKSAFKEVMV